MLTASLSAVRLDDQSSPHRSPPARTGWRDAWGLVSVWVGSSPSTAEASGLCPTGHADPPDPNQLGKLTVDISTGKIEDADPDVGKDPAAVALGRKGGLRGGKARAAKLTAEKRQEAARKAARARCDKRNTAAERFGRQQIQFTMWVDPPARQERAGSRGARSETLRQPRISFEGQQAMHLLEQHLES